MLMNEVNKIERTTLNVVECDGAICVSIDENIDRYYAQNVSSRLLDIKKYQYEVVK